MIIFVSATSVLGAALIFCVYKSKKSDTVSRDASAVLDHHEPLADAEH